MAAIQFLMGLQQRAAALVLELELETPEEAVAGLEEMAVQAALELPVKGLRAGRAVLVGITLAAAAVQVELALRAAGLVALSAPQGVLELRLPS